MKKPKQLGIWMDDSVAYLMEYTTIPFEIQTIICELPVEENESLDSIKKHVLNKYYNKIGEALKNHKRIVLFLSSGAKINFFDFLTEDERFLKLKVEIKNISSTIDNQQHKIIREYFQQDS